MKAVVGTERSAWVNTSLVKSMWLSAWGSRSREKPLRGGISMARRSYSLFFWMLFIAGLLVQAFGPHLKIQNNQFVAPPSLVASGQPIRPDELVAHERSLQLLSGVLTLAGALGLAFRYRKTLQGKHFRPNDPVGDNLGSLHRSRIAERFEEAREISPTLTASRPFEDYSQRRK
jgi:hypothetical protein